jgi:hypothetical protein
MIFHCNENGTVLNWGGEYEERSDRELGDVISDFAKTFKTNKENHNG